MCYITYRGQKIVNRKTKNIIILYNSYETFLDPNDDLKYGKKIGNIISKKSIILLYRVCQKVRYIMFVSFYN